MSLFRTTNRDLTIERILIDRGFNRDTFLAVNDIIRKRMEGRRIKAEAQHAVLARQDTKTGLR